MPLLLRQQSFYLKYMQIFPVRESAKVLFFFKIMDYNKENTQKETRQIL